MKIKHTHLYLSLAIIQLMLSVAALPGFFFHAANAMFFNRGDGYKNYFTLLSYVKFPLKPDGLFKFNAFAYPYGDYVYYTDNTPLFSIPFRWICTHVTDLSASTIPLYNFFIIANIIVSGLLVFFIFRRVLGSNVFSFALAIFLPWVNMQMPRLWEGDFNLSCSTPVLTAIALFIMWYCSTSIRQYMMIGFGMVLLIFLSFLLHGYYVAIIAAFLSGMLFFMGIFSFKKFAGRVSLLASVFIPFLAFAAVFALLHGTDYYLSLRPVKAMCYDCAILKTNFLLLFTHYDFHSLAFPVASTRVMDMESMVYLGNIGLFAFGAMWVGAVFSKPFRLKVLAIQKDFFADPLKKALFWGGFMMLMISLGENYGTNRDKLVIYTPIPWLNALNPNLLLIMIGITALAIYGIVLLFNLQARAKLKAILVDYQQHPFRKLLLLLVVGLMIFLFIGRYSVQFVNILNPFLYMHFFTKEVEQFRSLSRFAWPFFWVFYIWIMYTFIQLYHQARQQTKIMLVILFSITGSLEMFDYIHKAQQATNNPNLLAPEAFTPFSKLKTVNQYQAILPIPYYTVGSEDYPHTIDDNNDWTTFTTQLSLFTHLPLMSCKMSRIPVSHNLALLNMVCNDSLEPDLKDRLNDKPVLVAFNRKLVNDANQAGQCSSSRPETIKYYLKANEFVSRHHLAAIDSLGDIVFYSWNPK